VFDPKTGEVNLTTEEGQSFLKAVNALAAASPAEKAAAEKAVKKEVAAGTGTTDVDQTDSSVIRGSSTQPGGYAAAIDGGDKITYGGYDILQQAKGGLVKKSKGSAKDELARFANGGEADAELLRRQLENIDNTPSTRTPERAPTPEQTESRTMLENLRSGFAQIPQTVMGYGRDVLQSEDPLARVSADVSALGSGALESIKQDPLGTLADMTPILGEIRSGRDAVKFSNLANEARAANDLDAAAMYEQMSTLAAAGATPLIGTAGRIGRRIAGAPDEAMMRMAGSNTPTAADDLAELTDRVPSPATKNVEEIFNLDQRATNADLPKSRDTLVFMSPDDFLAMAAPTRADYSFTSSEGKEKTKSILAGIQKGDLIDVPHLKIFDKDGVAQVEGHDGRHRAALMKELGYDRMPVIISSHRIRWADQLKSGRDQIEGSWPTVLRSEKDPWGKINKESRDIPFPVKDPRPSADDLAELKANAPINTPEFKNFFGESKVVDAKGKPLPVYHGTSSDFTVFRPSEDGRLGRGIYLSSEERLAKGFRGADKLMRLYVSMQNPAYEYDLIPERVGDKMKGDEYEKELHNRAIGGGFDGIIKGSSTDVFGNPRTPDSWGNFVVFNPTQIKSAIGNEGTFDPARAPTEVTPNLTRFLANSQVKEPVFHAAKADVKEFSPKYRTELSSMGFHFGTADQANFRTGQYDFDSKSPNIGKYYLNIENPLEVSHMASFAPDHLAEKMMDMDLLTEDAYDVLSAKNDYDAIATGDSLVKILKKNGYDGLKYKNEREGEGFSYVPFSSTQIKSAIGNEGTFDPTNPVITKAKGGAITKNNVERMRNDNRKYL
jgi:hypothetical protein